MLKRLAVFLIIVFAMAGFTVTASAYQISSAKYIYVDDDGTVTRHATNEEKISRFLKNEKIVLAERDVMDKSPDEDLVDGMVITIGRSKEVTVTLDGVPRKIYSTEKTVGELLKNNRDLICVDYVIDNCEEKDTVTDKMSIHLTSSEVKTYAKTEKVAYTTTYIDDASMYVGTEIVETEGIDGELKTVYKETYVNDKLISTEEVLKTTISKPVERVVRRGTCNTINGMTFKSAVNVLATGYTPYDEGCTGITATGAKATKGIIAADTRVLPFGTKIYVPGYGVGVVADRGGAIKGNRIDLCYDGLQDALNWGVRNITIYVLE